MKTFYASLLALGICLGLTFPAMAEYPAKPIMLMTAFNAGGGSDLSHRLIEKFAKGVIPQPIVVTYKAGAGGEIGWTWLIGAKADGYNIGGVDLPHIVLQPMLRPASPLSRRQQGGTGAARRRSGLLFRFHIQLPAYAGRARPRHCNQGSL